MKIGLYILILLNQVHLKNAKESEKSEKSQETRKYHINDMYPNDPKELWGLKDYESDGQAIEQNSKWMENVMNKPKISNFITKMINIRNALPITPASLVTHVDDTPYCWAFLAYDSILDNKIFASLIELGQGLSKYFYGRCGIGFIDLSYPSNRATFANEIFLNSPCLVIRKPLHDRRMFNVSNILDPGVGVRLSKTVNPISVNMNPVSDWGEIIGAKDLGEQPAQAFQKIDAIHEAMHENYQIASLFMEHYDFTKAEFQRWEMRHFLSRYQSLLHNSADDEMKKAGFDLEKEDDIEKAMNFVTNRMKELFKERPLKRILTNIYDQEVIRKNPEKNIVLDRDIFFIPEPMKNIAELIPLWLKLNFSDSPPEKPELTVKSDEL